MIFTKYYPAFVTGFDKYEISGSLLEILSDPRNKKLSDINDFYKWSFAMTPGPTLVIEFDEGRVHYVIGYLSEIPDLPEWKPNK